MAKKTITLGTVPTVETVFAYKNIPDQNESLEETVKHWLGQTLARDGFDNATINVSQSVSQMVFAMSNWTGHRTARTKNMPND